MGADTTTSKQRVVGRPFPKGVSGNPAGRPKGSRHKTLLALEALFDDEGDAISRKAIELAKGGDPGAMRLCLERILPVRKDRPICFELPPIETASDAAKAHAAVLAAVADGSVTPTEAADLGKLIESFVKTVEVADFKSRLAKLEQRE